MTFNKTTITLRLFRLYELYTSIFPNQIRSGIDFEVLNLFRIPWRDPFAWEFVWPLHGGWILLLTWEEATISAHSRAAGKLQTSKSATDYRARLLGFIGRELFFRTVFANFNLVSTLIKFILIVNFRAFVCTELQLLKSWAERSSV